MSSKTLYKTVYYKHAVIAGSNLSLRDMLQAALSESSGRNKACSRHEPLNDSGDIRFINHYDNYNGMFFGQLISIESGKVQNFLKFDDNSNAYTINPIDLNNLDKEELESEKVLRREFVDSLLYFGVIDNHVAVLQSSALKARQLEAYLNWFLGSSCCNILPDNTPVILSDAIDETMKEKIERSPAKEIKVGTPIISQPLQTSQLTTVANAEVAKVRHTLDAQDTGLIKRFFGLNLNGKEFSDSLEGSNLSLELTLKFKNSTTKTGQDLIDQIASSLRHIDPEDYSIRLSDKSIIKGGELIVAGPIKLITLPSGAIDEGTLKHDIHVWLVQKADHDI